MTPRLWVVVLTTAVGVAAIVFAGNPGWFGRNSWPSVVPSVFVNFGTALIIAAPLVFLERAFTKRIQHVTMEVKNLRESVNTLTDRIAELVRTRDERTDRALTALVESPSFETITRALEMANTQDALADGIATVQGGTDPADDKAVDLEHPLSIRVRFLWGSRAGAPQPALLVQAVCKQEQYLFAQAGLSQENVIVDNNDYLCYEIIWAPTDSAESIGLRLREAVEGKGIYRGAETLDWGETISELRRTIGVAIASRRGGAPWPIASLFELVGDDWAITRMGVEYKSQAEFGPVFGPDEFPTLFPGGDDYAVAESSVAKSSLAESSYKVLRSASGVPQPSERVLARAEAHLPVRSSPHTPNGWKPVTTRHVTSDRGRGSA